VKKIIVILILVGMFFGASSLGQSRSLEIKDLGELVGVSQPTISSDGKRVVVVVSRPDYKDNKFVKKLLMVETETGKSRVLTTSRPFVNSPQFSPDDTELGFIAVGPKGKPQLFVLPLSGGEARQVTKTAEGLSFYSWSPDGKSFAFSTMDSKDPIAKNGLTPDSKHNRSFEVGDNGYLASKVSRPTHLWVISADGGEMRRLTAGPIGLATFFGRGFDWGTDGIQLVAQLQANPHSAGFLSSSIVQINVESGEMSSIVDEGPPPFLPRFAPDGERVVFLRSTGPELFFNPAGIFVAEPDRKTLHLSHNIDRDIRYGGFLPERRSLLTSGVDRTSSKMWEISHDGESRTIDLGSVHLDSTMGFADMIAVADSGTIAFVGSEPNHPDELYVMNSVNDHPRRLTDLNNEIAGRRMGLVETVTWGEPDGFDLNGVLVYPPDYQKGKRYPLVLDIHGGPMGVSTEAFNFRSQLMASKGWIVFSPNYRGSSSQGRAFQAAIINDAGDGPGRDVMSGIAELKRRGMVDETKIAVSGWSYGGYMAAWLTAHHGGWTASVAGAAVTDWFDWYNLADINVWSGLGLGGSPWLNGNAANYWNQSPMKYAHQIKTPTLILANTGDPRVTISQSYKLYRALKDNRVPVKFVAYPISGHFPQDPVHLRDLHRRWIDWIDRHFTEAEN
jgi:dipeptidyl aminopeptidase/acylaminoacyl peptidase